jgi:hypothetical protein
LPLWRRLQVVRLWRVIPLRIAGLTLHGRTPIAAGTLLPRTTSPAWRSVGLTRWPWIAARFRTAHRIRQRGNVVVIELNEGTAFEATRQHDRTVANANQTADGVANRFKHAAYFAVSAFRNRHFVPAVGTLAAAGFNRPELSHAVVELHAFQQAFFLFVVECTEHTHSVFALQTKTRMHQLIGELARTRQQQQTLGVQVKPTDRLPLALVELGQTPKNGGPVLRVIMGDNLASRLVVRDDTGRGRVDPHTNRLAIDLDRVAKLDALTDVSRFGVNRNSALQNELLHFQT